MSNEAKWFPEGALADLPDIEAARDRYPIIGWNVEPGDVVYMLTLRAAGGVPVEHPWITRSSPFYGDDSLRGTKLFPISMRKLLVTRD
jgi:hypothetical protein